MNRIKIKTVMKCGDYKIDIITDYFENWVYWLFYKGKARISSWDFERLNNIAINDILPIWQIKSAINVEIRS